MAPKQQKTKAEKAIAAMSGGKSKKKKWSKGKSKDKLNNAVLFSEETYKKLYKDVPAYKMITPAIVSERLKIRCSLARHALRQLESEGKIQFVVKHSKAPVYTTLAVEEATE